MRSELQSICEHVGRYCREDRSEKAVLLSGEWGCGKSHFVHNELKEYLESKTQAFDIVRCCYVSLYGASSVSEVSRRLFYELRGISTKSRTKAVVQIAINTVARAALDSVHVDVIECPIEHHARIIDPLFIHFSLLLSAIIVLLLQFLLLLPVRFPHHVPVPMCTSPV